MPKKLYEESSIQAIANAIRARNGSETTYKISEMPAAIEAIKGGFPNGTEWTVISPGVNMSSIVYANGIWVGSGIGIYYSTDGKTWTQSNITSGYYNFVNANGIWVGYRYNYGFIYSTDGKTWTQSNITSGGSTVAYGNGIWVGGAMNSVYSISWEPT